MKSANDETPADEGTELFDGNGDDIEKECSNSFVPFLVQLEGVTARARRTVLESIKIDGILAETLSTNVCSVTKPEEQKERVCNL